MYFVRTKKKCAPKICWAENVRVTAPKVAWVARYGARTTTTTSSSTTSTTSTTAIWKARRRPRGEGGGKEWALAQPLSLQVARNQEIWPWSKVAPRTHTHTHNNTRAHTNQKVPLCRCCCNIRWGIILSSGVGFGQKWTAFKRAFALLGAQKSLLCLKNPPVCVSKKQD